MRTPAEAPQTYDSCFIILYPIRYRQKKATGPSHPLPGAVGRDASHKTRLRLFAAMPCGRLPAAFCKGARPSLKSTPEEYSRCVLPATPGPANDLCKNRRTVFLSRFCNNPHGENGGNTHALWVRGCSPFRVEACHQARAAQKNGACCGRPRQGEAFRLRRGRYVRFFMISSEICWGTRS